MLHLFCIFCLLIVMTLALPMAKYPTKSAGPSYLHVCSQPGTLCPVSNHTHRLHVILDRLPGHLAACACAAHNMKLASITEDNLDAVTDLVKECVGEYQDLWVHAWDGENYEGIGLAVRSQKDAPLKALPRHNDQIAQALCVEHF